MSVCAWAAVVVSAFCMGRCASAAEFDFAVIADLDTSHPGGPGTFTVFGPPSLDRGVVAFEGHGSGFNGIYATLDGLAVVADETTTIPGGTGTFTTFSAPSLGGGRVAFQGGGAGGQTGIYLGIGGLDVAADTGTAIPGGTGTFSGFGAPALDEAGVAFEGHGSGQNGIYADVGGLDVVADTTTAVPGAGGTFADFDSPSLDGGHVAFRGVASGGQVGIYARIGALSRVADTTTAIPDGAGSFTDFGAPCLDDGHVVFRGSGSGGQAGIYTDIGGLSVVADAATAIPGGTGAFTDFGNPSLDDGHVAFPGSGPGGRSGVYTTVGGLDIVAHTDTPIPGGTGTFTGFGSVRLDGDNVVFAGSGPGQSGIYAAFPTHQWRSPASGAWDAAGNWLFDVLPRLVVPTRIDPEDGLIVTGPAAPTAVRSLSLGARTSGVATLELQPGGSLTVEEGLEITPRGRVTGNGVLRALGGVTNLGEVHLGTGSFQVSGGPFMNGGLMCGSGSVDNVLTNTASGEVRVETGRRLVFTAPGNTNAGDVRLLGGLVEFEADLTNVPTGFISGRGVLDVAAGMTNQGTVALSGGYTDIYGDVTNQETGRLVVSGGGTATFYDDVVSDGEIRVSEEGRAVFFGALTGTGGTTGAGTVYIEGDLRPGHSPAEVDFGGDVVFGSAAALEAELGGGPGASDAVHVAGTATLGGTLAVALLDPWRPAHNDAVRVMTFASRGGTTFDTYDGLDLGNRLRVVPTYGETDLVLTAAQGGSGAWAVDAGGLASVPGHWASGLPNGPGDVATFGPVITAPRDVTVDVATVVGGLVFDSTKAYTLAGPGALSFETASGPAAIDVTGGAATHTIAADAVVGEALEIDVAALGALVLEGLLDNGEGRTLTKTGAGTLVVDGPQAHGLGAVLEVLGGAVEIRTDASGTGRLQEAHLSILVDGAELRFGCDQHLDTLEVGDGGVVRFAGANVVVVRHLVMNGTDLGAATLTPEPASLVLLAVGGSAVLACRRRGHAG
jgi:hypothetical protein